MNKLITFISYINTILGRISNKFHIGMAVDHVKTSLCNYSIFIYCYDQSLYTQG